MSEWVRDRGCRCGNVCIYVLLQAEMVGDVCEVGFPLLLQPGIAGGHGCGNGGYSVSRG
jgi:hypothetical protein